MQEWLHFLYTSPDELEINHSKTGVMKVGLSGYVDSGEPTVLHNLPNGIELRLGNFTGRIFGIECPWRFRPNEQLNTILHSLESLDASALPAEPDPNNVRLVIETIRQASHAHPGYWGRYEYRPHLDKEMRAIIAARE